MKKYSKKVKFVAVSSMVSALVLVQTGAGFLADPTNTEPSDNLQPDFVTSNNIESSTKTDGTIQKPSDSSTTKAEDEKTQDTPTVTIPSGNANGTLVDNITPNPDVDDSYSKPDDTNKDDSQDDSSSDSNENNNSQEKPVEKPKPGKDDVVLDDGSIKHPNGSITLPDGTIKYPEGSVVNPDGSLTLVDGTKVLTDGTKIDKDGTVHHPDGTITTPEGDHLNPDGTPVTPGGTNQNKPEGPQSPSEETPQTPDSQAPSSPDQENGTPMEEGTSELPNTDAPEDTTSTTPESDTQTPTPTVPQGITKNPVFNDTSVERFTKYLQYRNEIHAKLKQEITKLTNEFDTRTKLLASLLGKNGETCKIYEKTPVLVDKVGIQFDQEFDDAETTLVAKEVSDIEVSNWGDVLAVFVARSSLSVADPLDLMNLREISWDNLDEIFNDMNTVTYAEENNEMHVYINSLTYEDMAKKYNMNDAQKKTLEELMQPEFQSVFANLTGNTMFNTLTQEQIQKLKAALPSELSLDQAGIVSTAYSLVGQVPYFWGGKYPHVGANPQWGALQAVTASGSSSSGSIRPYGLDCSGYVSWVFVNATKNPAIAKALGESTSTQWSNSVSLGWDEGKPGDLVFAKVPGNGINHVGIIVSVKEDGNYMVAHCSSSFNNVVVTDAWATGLRYIRRPYFMVQTQQPQATTGTTTS